MFPHLSVKATKLQAGQKMCPKKPRLNRCIFCGKNWYFLQSYFSCKSFYTWYIAKVWIVLEKCYFHQISTSKFNLERLSPPPRSKMIYPQFPDLDIPFQWLGRDFTGSSDACTIYQGYCINLSPKMPLCSNSNRKIIISSVKIMLWCWVINWPNLVSSLG